MKKNKIGFQSGPSTNQPPISYSIKNMGQAKISQFMIPPTSPRSKSGFLWDPACPRETNSAKSADSQIWDLGLLPSFSKTDGINHLGMDPISLIRYPLLRRFEEKGGVFRVSANRKIASIGRIFSRKKDKNSLELGQKGWSENGKGRNLDREKVDLWIKEFPVMFLSCCAEKKEE